MTENLIHQLIEHNFLPSIEDFSDMSSGTYAEIIKQQGELLKQLQTFISCV